MDEFTRIRNEYKKFIYKNYKIIETEETIELEFNYEIVGLTSFSHKLKLNIIDIKDYRSYKNYKEEYENIAFNLGMMEAISYMKLTCSNQIVVECGYLTEENINWYKKVFFLGLGEFLYLNNIQIKQEELFDIQSNLSYKKENNEAVYDNNGVVIPIGGGKDSVVTIELLKHLDPCYFIVNPRGATLDCLEIASNNNAENIKINRYIDPKLIELNPSFLNGHIPITAIMCFITFLSAFISKKKYIAFSNESSASEATIIGTNINHQYSKSLEYEKDFIDFCEKNMPYNIKCFSFLRGLNELQITKIFSTKKNYHNIFKSCNKGSKTNIWCLDCPKCLFVYIMLSAFLTEEEVLNVFGENLLNKKELLNTFLELIGEAKTKPFECVGTIEEVNLAINMIINKEQENPYLIQYYKENYMHLKFDKNLLKEYNEDNCLDEMFEEIIKGVLYEK